MRASAAALLVVLLAGCGGGGARERPTTTPLPGTPVGLAARGDRVYVTVTEGATGVVALDAETAKVLGVAATRAIPLRLALDGDGLWVSEFGTGSVARVDTKTMRVTARVPVGEQPEGLVVHRGLVWVVLQAQRQLVAVDPRRARVVRRVELEQALEPRLVSSAAGRLWVSDFAGGQLIAVDPQTGTAAAPVRVCAGAQAMAPRGRDLWVACTSGNEVVRLDTRSRRVTARVPVANGPDGIAFAGEKLLVVDDVGPALTTIDPAAPGKPARRQVARGGVLGDANTDVVAANGRAWVGFFDSRRVYSLPLGS